MTEERWLPVVGYEGFYEVSDAGQVRSLPRKGSGGRIMTRSLNSNGYPNVTLRKDGAHVTRAVHLLVIEAFVGPRPGPGYQCCHNDGSRTNNSLSNLRWDTVRGNAQDKVLHGTQSYGEQCNNAKLTRSQVLSIIADPRKNCVIAADYDINATQVSLIKQGKTWNHLWQGGRPPVPVAKAERCHGERHPNAKLTEAQVLAIAADPRPNQQIAPDYGVTDVLIGRIKRRLSWKHLWQNPHPLAQ